MSFTTRGARNRRKAQGFYPAAVDHRKAQGFSPVPLLLIFLLLLSSAHASAQPPSPETFFGFRMGADGQLADWPEIERYFTAVADASDRVKLVDAGTSTEGRHIIAAIVSAPENIKRLDAIRDANQRLADPRTLADAEAARPGCRAQGRRRHRREHPRVGDRRHADGQRAAPRAGDRERPAHAGDPARPGRHHPARRSTPTATRSSSTGTGRRRERRSRAGRCRGCTTSTSATTSTATRS